MLSTNSQPKFMIKYLQRNKEWIFSGCGVAVLLLAGQFIWRHLSMGEKPALNSGLASAQLSPAIKSSPPITAIPSSPVTFDEINRVAHDSILTELQKDEFRRKHQGRIIEWTVRVHSVGRLWEHRADSDFAVVFGALEVGKSHFGDNGVAIFPTNLRDDLIDLHRNDVIRLCGMLNFNPITNSVNLDNCQLLEHQKSDQ
jgi:hypothetical protein